MTLRMVGAGVGRTGTEPLKVALEHLLGGPCYHMLEALSHPESVAYWAAAGRSDMPDWDQVFDGYVAAVDWPVAAYWPELSEAFPDVLGLLSTRASAQEWVPLRQPDHLCGRPLEDARQRQCVVHRWDVQPLHFRARRPQAAMEA